jgi:hypothetical protein
LITVRLTASKSILENLLETQEFKDGKGDGGMESKASLVRPESGVELNAESSIDLNLALVVLPSNTELNNTLRNRSNLQSNLILWVFLEQCRVLEGGDKLY